MIFPSVSPLTEGPKLIKVTAILKKTAAKYLADFERFIHL